MRTFTLFLILTITFAPVSFARGSHRAFRAATMTSTSLAPSIGGGNSVGAGYSGMGIGNATGGGAGYHATGPGNSGRSGYSSRGVEDFRGPHGTAAGSASEVGRPSSATGSVEPSSVYSSVGNSGANDFSSSPSVDTVDF